MSIVFEGPVTFHERVTLTRAHSDVSRSRNIGIVFELRGPVRADLLIAATAHLDVRHDALRTSFVRRDGTFVRRVHDTGGGLEVLDLVDREQPDRDARAWLQDFGSLVRPLDSAPLWRAALVRIEAERHYLAIVVDHVIGDYYSAAVVLTELGQAYNRLCAGEPLDASPAPQQRDLVPVIGDLLAPVFADRERWLKPWPDDGYALSSDVTDEGDAPSGTGLLSLQVPSSKRALTVAKRRGVSRSACYLAAFVVALRERSGRADVGFSVARSGRRTQSQWGTIGYQVYTDTWSVQTPGGAPLSDLVAEADAFVRDGAPWRRVYNALVAPPTRRVLFNLRSPGVRLDLTDVQAFIRPDLLPIPELFNAHDLVLQVVALGRVDLGMLAYRESRLQASSMKHLGSTFSKTLAELMADG